jgi:hypothetical protein
VTGSPWAAAELESAISRVLTGSGAQEGSGGGRHWRHHRAEPLSTVDQSSVTSPAHHSWTTQQRPGTTARTTRSPTRTGVRQAGQTDSVLAGAEIPRYIVGGGEVFGEVEYVANTLTGPSSSRGAGERWTLGGSPAAGPEAWPIVGVRRSTPSSNPWPSGQGRCGESPTRTCGAARSARRPVKPEVAGSNPVRSATSPGQPVG